MSFVYGNWGIGDLGSRISRSPPSERLVNDMFIGVEVEVDRVFDINVPRGWTGVEEGSLREEGMEFVLSTPRNGRELIQCLENLEDRLRGTSAYMSKDTSVHVHFDMTSLDEAQVLRTVVAFVVFEDVLMNMFAKDRMKNPFCARISDSPGILKTVANYLTSSYDPDTPDFLREEDTHITRYLNINIRSLSKFGTLEIRGMHGTYNANEIINWINAWMAVYQFAISSSTSVPLRLKNMAYPDAMRMVFEAIQPVMRDAELYKRGLVNARRLVQLITKIKQERGDA